MRASVIEDSTLALFRRPVCMKLRQCGYDVSMYQCRSGAWENQIAVDSTASPRVDLCLALSNGNRLAGESQLAELSSFDFPERWRYGAEGVRFLVGEGRAASLDTRPTLPAEHPPPSQQSSDRPSLEYAESFIVQQQVTAECNAST